MPRAKKYGVKSRLMALGAKMDKAGPFVLRQLALNDRPRPMGEIAKSAGICYWSVSKINKMYGVRSPAEAFEIGVRAASAKIKAQRKRTLRKKVGYFSEAEKTALLEQQKESLTKLAKNWWRSSLIKREFGDFDAFVQAMNTNAFDMLDYYNPQVRGREGKHAKPSTWIFGGAKIFCSHSYSRAARKREKPMPVDKRGLPIAQTGEVRATKEIRSESTRPGLQWISSATNSFLKVLGLDPNKVAKLGFADIKKQLIKISEAKETALSEREKKIVKMTLDGKRIEDIAYSFRMTHQNISVIRQRIAKKIRWQLRARKIKKS